MISPVSLFFSLSKCLAIMTSTLPPLAITQVLVHTCPQTGAGRLLEIDETVARLVEGIDGQSGLGIHRVGVAVIAICDDDLFRR